VTLQIQDLKIVRERQSFDFETRKATILAYIAARITPQALNTITIRSDALSSSQYTQQERNGSAVRSTTMEVQFLRAVKQREVATRDIDIDDMTTYQWYHRWRRYQPRPTTPPCVSAVYMRTCEVCLLEPMPMWLWWICIVAVSTLHLIVNEHWLSDPHCPTFAIV